MPVWKRCLKNCEHAPEGLALIGRLSLSSPLAAPMPSCVAIRRGKLWPCCGRRCLPLHCSDLLCTIQCLHYHSHPWPPCPLATSAWPTLCTLKCHRDHSWAIEVFCSPLLRASAVASQVASMPLSGYKHTPPPDEELRAILYSCKLNVSRLADPASPSCP